MPKPTWGSWGYGRDTAAVKTLQGAEKNRNTLVSLFRLPVSHQCFPLTKLSEKPMDKEAKKNNL